MLSLTKTKVLPSTQPAIAHLQYPAMSQCNRWKDSELSLGSPCASLDRLGRYKCWSVKEKSPAHAAWKVVSKAIISLLEDQFEHLDAGDSDLKIEMFMVGRKPVGSIPTILFSCESKTCRQKAMALVQKKAILAAYPAVVMAECARLPKLLARGEQPDLPFLPPGVYSSGPLKACGTPMLISTGSSKPSCRATLGGLVTIDAKLYGITASHAFMDPKEETTIDDTGVDFAFYGADDPFESSDDDDENSEITSQGRESPSSDPTRADYSS